MSPRKDVELVVRAKDQASKTVDKIADAIVGLVKGQGDLTNSAGKSDDALSRMTDAFAKLGKELKGLTVAGKLEGEFKRAESAITRLDAATASSRGEQQRLTQEIVKAVGAYDKLVAAMDESRAEQDRATAALRNARTAQSAATSDLKAGVDARDRLAGAEKKLADQITKQVGVLRIAEERYSRLRGELAATEEPTKRQAQAVERAGAALDKARAKLTGYEEKLGTTRTASTAAAESIAKLEATANAANAEFDRQKAALESAGAGYKDLGAQARAAAKHVDSLKADAEQVSDALERQEQELATARVEYQQFGAAIGKAEEAMREMQSLASGGLATALGQQEKAVAAANREWRDAQQTVLKLGRDLSDAEAKAARSIFGYAALAEQARKLAVSFEQAKIDSQKLGKEYDAQSAGLASLKAIAAQTGDDIDTLTARQQAFQAAQAKTAKEVLEVRDAAAQQSAALRKAAAEAEKAAQAQNALGGGARNGARGLGEARTATEALSAAYRSLYGDSRQALSIQQRIRGEVLALANSYLGLFAAIQGIKGVQAAVQELEAAQVKLAVAFEDPQQQANELAFVREEAARLGLEFGTLANQYAKLQVATQGSNVNVDQTRQLFIAVSESARVLKLDNERLTRVFTAFEQIASKGVVSMEELRQQLGDNLTGAVTLFAEALGYSRDNMKQFFDDVAEGKVSSDALALVADRLRDKFGSQLEQALDSNAAAMGRFQNAVFETAIRIGEGGLIDALTRLYDTLTEVSQTEEFRSFLDRVGAGAGLLIDVLSALARNFDTVVIAASFLVGVKLVPFFIGLVEAVVLARNAFITMTVASKASEGALYGIGRAAGAAGLALRTALIATGVGAVVVGLTTAFGFWATSVDESTAALEKSEGVIQSITAAYLGAEEGANRWATALETVEANQARASMNAQFEAMNKALNDFNDALPKDIFGNIIPEYGEFARQASALFDEFLKGGMATDEFQRRLSDLSEEFRGSFGYSQELADSLAVLGGEVADNTDKYRVLRDIVIAKTGSDEEAAAAQERLNEALGLGTSELEDAENATAASAKATDDFAAAMNELKKFIPELNDELEKADKISKIETAFQNALAAARQLPDAIMRIAAAQDALATRDVALGVVNGQLDFTGGAGGGAAALLKEFEGFSATPYYDVNAFRAGFGSDTVTLADGSVQKVVEGITVSMEDANRDLARRIVEFQNVIIGQIGGERFKSFSESQQAALTSIAYNYGELPGRIVNAVRTGTTAEIASAIRGLEGDNGGINSKRRNREADIFAAGGDPNFDSYIDAEKERTDELKKQNEEKAKFLEQQEADLANQEFELSIQDQSLLQQEIAKALRDAENEAKEVGLELTDEQRQRIIDVTTAKYAEKSAQDATNTSIEAAKKAEEEVNNLLAQRSELEKQLELQKAAGDTEAMKTTRAEITEINSQLGGAVDNAIKLWQAIGGTAADAAIAKLQTAKMEAAGLRNEGQQNRVTWEQVGQVFGSRLLSAFDQFSQAVAEGKSIGEAAREAFLRFAADFLREIAQMIIKQALLNALRKFQGGGGFLGGVFAGLAHTGGVVGSKTAGSGNPTRRVNPGVFASAGRFHNGGLPGLKNNEVATILKKGEEVVTEDDPRHIMNGAGFAGAGGGKGTSMKIVNAFDPVEVMDASLSDSRGQEVFINTVSLLKTAVRAALEI
jgi:tape measure domain-containing protein